MRRVALIAVLCAAPVACAGPASAEVFVPTLLGETDYRVYSTQSEGPTGFAVARLRPGLNLTPLEWAQVTVLMELAKKEPSIVDAFGRLTYDAFALTLGYAKTPLFSSFTHHPLGGLAFGDYSATVKSFGGHRDVGLTAEVSKPGLPFEVAARIGNGSNSPLGNDDFGPAGYCAAHLVLGAEQRGSTQPYGLRLGVGAMYESTPDREGISVMTPLNFKAYRATIVHGARAIGTASFAASVPRLRLAVDGAVARESRALDHDGNPNTPRVEADPSVSYSVTTEVVAMPLGAPGEARLQIGARFERLWLGRGTDEVRPGGLTQAVLGAKGWLTPYFALSAEGYFGRLDTAPVEHPDEHNTYGGFVRASIWWHRNHLAEPAVSAE